MPTWFIGQIAYQTTDDSVNVNTKKDGSAEAPKMKTEKETYLIDAVSYTDAEARLYKIVADNTPDFEIVFLRPKRLADVFRITPDGHFGKALGIVNISNMWYQCKTQYDTESDKGVKKTVRQTMLINAENVKQAHERLEIQLQSMLVPVEITDINITPILEVYTADMLDMKIMNPDKHD